MPKNQPNCYYFNQFFLGIRLFKGVRLLSTLRYQISVQGEIIKREIAKMGHYFEIKLIRLAYPTI